MEPVQRRRRASRVQRIVQENVRLLRGTMTYVDLTARLTELGCPIAALGLARLEAGDRSINVDELVAFATIFGLEPASLLVPLKVEHKIHVELA